MSRRPDDIDPRLARLGWVMAFIVLILWMLFGCHREEPPQSYPYLPGQLYNLEITVRPVEEAEFNLDKLNRELNADYLNRYGISASLVEGDRIQLDTNYLGEGSDWSVGRIFLPNEKRDSRYKMTLWVVEGQNMISGVGGYAIGNYNMVIRESNLYGTTPAHEIGHLLGLGHVTLSNNVMLRVGNREYRIKPRDFVEQQVDTMLRSLDGKNTLNVNAIYYD